MPENNLSNYIKQSRDNGVSDEQIRNALLGSGWQEADINQALLDKIPMPHNAQFPHIVESSLPRASKRIFIFLLVALVFFSGGYGISAKFFNLWPFGSTDTIPNPSLSASINTKTQRSSQDAPSITKEVDFTTTKLATIPNRYEATNPLFSPNGRSVAYRVKSPIIYAEKKNICKGEFEDVKHLLEQDSRYEKLLVDQYGDGVKKELQKIKNQTGGEYGLCAITKKIVVLSGRDLRWESRQFDSVDSVVFSPDGGKLIYVVREEKENFVVVGDREGKRYDSIVSQNQGGTLSWIIFAPGGNDMAYVASRNGKSFVVVNDQEGKPYDSIEYLTFSSDGKKVVYVGAEKGVSFMVVGDKEDKKYPDIRQVSGPCLYCGKDDRSNVGEITYLKAVTRPIFNPVTQGVAYTVQVDNKWSAVIDGKESPRYDYVSGITFSPDGKTVFYAVRSGEKTVIYENGQVNKKYAGLPLFSPDGKRTAYIETRKNSSIRTDQYVVVDGKEGKPYRSVYGFVFSPDSKTFAYIATLGFPGIRGNAPATFLVLGTKEGARYESINFGTGAPSPDTLPNFSSNSKNVAYFAERDRKGYIVVGEREIREKNGRPQSYPVFSPDGKYIAYGAWIGLEKQGSSTTETELWWMSVPIQ